MNKNIVISVLTVVLVIFLGYLALNNLPPQQLVDDETKTTDTTSPLPLSPVTTVREVRVPTIDKGFNAIPSNSTAVVSGKVTPNGAPTTYWYDYGLTDAVGIKTSIQTLGSGFNAINTPGYITGLRANTKYFFRLSAENRLGLVHGTTYEFTTNNTPAPQGSAPSIQTSSATDVDRDSAKVNGKVNANGYATDYWFEYGENDSLGDTTDFESIGSKQVSLSVSASISSLKPLTKYYFRLNAQNQYGTVIGSLQTFTTDGTSNESKPSVKTNPASNIENSSATLRGTLDPNGADTTYWFEYGKDSTLEKLLISSTPTQSMNESHAETGVEDSVNNLSKNTRYYYRLLARNQYGTVKGSIMYFKTTN